MKAQIRIAFEDDMLIIGATASYAALPRLAKDASSVYMPSARVVRKYPVSELTARSNVFTKASAINFVEQHMFDKLRLEIFEAGYDARDLDFEAEYVTSLFLSDSFGARHAYKWEHQPASNVLKLWDEEQGTAIYSFDTVGLDYRVCSATIEGLKLAAASEPVAISDEI